MSQPLTAGEGGDVPAVVEFDAPVAGTAAETPPFVCPNPERLAELTRTFLDIADPVATWSTDTQRYVNRGGSLRLCLAEIDMLSAPRETDIARAEARDIYLDLLLQPSRRPWEHTHQREQEDIAREQYVDHVMDRISEVLDAQTPEQALAVRQMPSLVEETSFREGETPTLQDLAANHLYILIDTALKEHIQRRQLVDEHHQRSFVARIAGSRLLRTVIGLGVFGLAVSPHVGPMLADHEQTAENIELGLRGLSGSVLALEAPELLRYTFWGIMHNRQTRKLHTQLAQNITLTDLSLRMTYNSTRYGGADGFRPVTGRTGTDDPEENRKRFQRLDPEFTHLNNDPGGKPYTGDQALGYAGRLLIERRDQLEAILAPDLDADMRRALFMQLCREVVEEDLARMRRGLTENKVRRFAVNMVTLPPALVLSPFSSTLSEATTLTRDTAGAIKHQSSAMQKPE